MMVVSVALLVLLVLHCVLLCVFIFDRLLATVVLFIARARVCVLGVCTHDHLSTARCNAWPR